jgi:CRP-like cAMP-binding protein
MTTKTMKDMLAEHSFFEGLGPKYLEYLAGCATNVVFEAGKQIFREGEPADHFYLIRHGKVSIEVYAPGPGSLSIQTIGEGEVVGWSWLVPPYEWRFDARAVDLTRAFALDGECLRGKCEEDKVLGYELAKRFVQVMVARIEATRLQLLDLYGARA